MDFLQFYQNSTISKDITVTPLPKTPNEPFFSYLLAEDPGPSIPNIVAILPDFDGFLPISQNSTIHTDLAAIRPFQWSFQPSVSHLLAEDPGPLIPSVVAILLHIEIFLQISSKLDHLYRFSRNLALPMVVLILCLPPARWGHRALYSQCSGNIASFRWISSNLIKTRLFIQI